jgi:hypothetical protein
VSRHRTRSYDRAEESRPVRRAVWWLVWLVLRTGLAAVVAVALAPVTLVAAGTAAYGWWRGWPPRRLFVAAGWFLPMALAWLIAVAAWPVGRAGTGASGTRMTGGGVTGTGVTGVGVTGTGVTGVGVTGTGVTGVGMTGSGVTGGGASGTAGPPGVGGGGLLFRVAAAPYRAWVSMWQLAGHGHLVAAAVAVAPPAVPLGIAVGGLAWAYRLFRMRTGAGGLTPEAPAAFDERQWRHQVRAARALAATPGALPLLARNGDVVAGATIRSVRHRAGRQAAIPYPRLRAHQVVIGSTGTGKTTLLLRLWAGFMAAGLRRHAEGTGRRPLLVVLDCKGGASSRKIADRARRVLRDAGARSTAIWPDEASLSLWSLPPDRLITTLIDLIEHGTGGAAYYTDVMEALVALAVYAPCGPPVNSIDFLGRLDADWLAAMYGASGDGGAVTTARSAERAFHDVKLRFAALWRRLGAGLDGGASFTDADAWYCVLEGTAEGAVAEAQARALTDLLAYQALSGERELLLAVDEFSAVSRRLPIWQLCERARSLGLAVQVSAQSWEGLAGAEDERQRVAATAEGGIWLLRTPRPEPVVALAGTLPRADTTRRFSGPGAWDGDGLSRTRLVPVLDGDIVRRLDVGQVAYIYRGGVTFLQIKRITGRQPATRTTSPAGGPADPVILPADAGRALGGPGRSAAPGDPPTIPLTMPAAGSAHGLAPVPGAGPAVGRWPGASPSPVPGPRPPDASEVLDEAFGERR